MDIFRGDVSQVDIIDAGAVFDVISYSWRGNEIIYGYLMMRIELFLGIRFPLPATVPLGLSHLLNHFKQAWSATGAYHLQSWRNSQTYSLFRS